MEGKTVVTVVAQDGHTSRLEGETAIVFVVDKIKEFLTGEVEQIEASTAYIGNEPPEWIFEKLIASLVSTLIKKDNEDNPMKASYKVFNVAQQLMEKSKDLRNRATKEQADAFIEESMDEFKEALKDILN